MSRKKCFNFKNLNQLWSNWCFILVDFISSKTSKVSYSFLFLYSLTKSSCPCALLRKIQAYLFYFMFDIICFYFFAARRKRSSCWFCPKEARCQDCGHRFGVWQWRFCKLQAFQVWCILKKYSKTLLILNNGDQLFPISNFLGWTMLTKFELANWTNN